MSDKLPRVNVEQGWASCCRQGWSASHSRQNQIARGLRHPACDRSDRSLRPRGVRGEDNGQQGQQAPLHFFSWFVLAGSRLDAAFLADDFPRGRG